jgi:hypothetical protein
MVFALELDLVVSGVEDVSLAKVMAPTSWKAPLTEEMRKLLAACIAGKELGDALFTRGELSSK